MNSKPIKTAVKCAALGSVLVFFVVLLTLVFSFLGTIICAALAGMMMGSTKPSRWLSLPTSLVFPAVIFTVLQVTRAELLGRQIILVTLLCFGAFWLTYFMAFWLMAFERNQQTASLQYPGVQPALTHRRNTAGDGSAAVPPASSAEPVVELKLEELQGKWSCELAGSDGRPQKRVIEITGGRLVLRALDPNGRVRSCASANLKLESQGSSKTLVVAPGMDPRPNHA